MKNKDLRKILASCRKQIQSLTNVEEPNADASFKDSYSWIEFKDKPKKKKKKKHKRSKLLKKLRKLKKLMKRKKHSTFLEKLILSVAPIVVGTISHVIKRRADCKWRCPA